MAEKKKSIWGLLLAIVGALVLLAVWLIGGYNRLVTVDEQVNQSFANVETQLQRRCDLIPNLMGIVQGAADFEQSTFTAVTEARTRWLNAQSADAKIEASNQLESALARLLVTVENYPQLEATQAFRDFQTQLEGTENRISVERTRYNESATTYNTIIRRFPTSVTADLFGFDRHELFESVAEAQDAPQVEFEF